MADSLRLRVLKALTAHLETITIANGYDVDLAGKVKRGKTVFGEEMLGQVPFLSILEPLKPGSGIEAGEEQTRRSEPWLILIQGFAQDDKENPSDPAYALMAAVEQCLGQVISINESSGNPEFPDAYNLGGLIGGLAYGPGLAHPPQRDISSKAFFYLPVTISLVYDVRRPYTAPNEL
jgi:hypothetical protein